MIDLKIKHKKDCAGCYACMNVCPTQSIIMAKDIEGFSYPKVDYDKCIRCEKCVNTCPIINSLVVNNKPEAFACINKDEKIRLESSSGGIFTLLAEQVIENGGVVFGAAFDDNFNLRHLHVEDKNEIYKCRGSKYLQSEIGRSYKKAKNFLEDGKKVLFSGTPCQIAGLKAYLNKEYANLFCVDLVCHGVPSPYVWDKYKECRETEAKSRICAASFRLKDIGWKQFSLQISFKNNTKYSKQHSEDYFMMFFLKNISLRPSCYDCKFKTLYRHSEITLADFWGIQNILPEFDDDKGTSLVIMNGEKGKNFLKEILCKVKYKKVNINDALKYNPLAIKSVDYNHLRKKFFKDLNRLSFDKLANKYSVDALYDKIKRKIKH